jgi:hypothetical protein
MPYHLDAPTLCPQCPYGVCIEDRRVNKVRGRTTEFRLKQTVAMRCTFGDFMPGTDNDLDPGRTFDEYLGQFRANALAAGAVLFTSGFNLQGAALAKVEGDVFELMEAGAIWNAFVAWNKHMDGHPWPSTVFTVPTGTVPTPSRKAAILKLPRGYVPPSPHVHQDALWSRGEATHLPIFRETLPNWQILGSRGFARFRRT